VSHVLPALNRLGPRRRRGLSGYHPQPVAGRPRSKNLTNRDHRNLPETSADPFTCNRCECDPLACSVIREGTSWPSGVAEPEYTVASSLISHPGRGTTSGADEFTSNAVN